MAQRDHEPRGRESIGFTRFTAPWLRAGLQWFGKNVLETGQMTWSTLMQRVGAMTEFDAFLAGNGSFAVSSRRPCSGADADA